MHSRVFRVKRSQTCGDLNSGQEREREREIPIEYSPMHCIQSDAVVVAVSVCVSDNCDL